MWNVDDPTTYNINAAATPVDVANGIIKYIGVSDDASLIAGYYSALFKLVNGSLTQRAPTSQKIAVQINPAEPTGV